jgi:hypothetical protein
MSRGSEYPIPSNHTKSAGKKQWTPEERWLSPPCRQRYPQLSFSAAPWHQRASPPTQPVTDSQPDRDVALQGRYKHNPLKALQLAGRYAETRMSMISPEYSAVGSSTWAGNNILPCTKYLILDIGFGSIRTFCPICWQFANLGHGHLESTKGVAPAHISPHPLGCDVQVWRSSIHH